MPRRCPRPSPTTASSRSRSCSPQSAVAARLGARTDQTLFAHTRAFLLRNPPLVAATAALMLPVELPPAADDIGSAMAFALAPIGFVALGVTLADEHQGRPVPIRLDRVVATAVVLRVGLAPALLLAVSLPLGGPPDAHLLLAAMPVGLNGLTTAHAHRLDAPLTAAIIAWSTIAVLAVALAAPALS